MNALWSKGLWIAAVLVSLTGLANGQLVWTGGVFPSTVGFTDSLNLTINEDELGTPAPGFSFYDSGPTNGSPKELVSVADAASQIVRANGYFAEIRLLTLENSGDRFGHGLYLEDTTDGGVHALISPDKVEFYDGDFSAWPGADITVNYTPDDFHTIRMQVAPGAGTAEVFVDGVSHGFIDATQCNVCNAQVGFGDGSSGSYGRSVVDYIVVNKEIPEPASLVLLALGGLAMVRRRRS